MNALQRRLDLVSLAGLLVILGSVLALYVTHRLWARGPLGVAAQGVTVVLMAWARLSFGTRSFHATASTTDGGLVTHGPYRFWRHPIYAAILYALLAATLTHLDAVSVAAFVVACGGTALRIACEEASLRATFPDAYPAYARRTRRLIPFVL